MLGLRGALGACPSNWNVKTMIPGGAGTDVIAGGSGDDVLAGGAGSDWFIVKVGDKILDLTSADQVTYVR